MYRDDKYFARSPARLTEVKNEMDCTISLGETFKTAFTLFKIYTVSDYYFYVGITNSYLFWE